MFKKAPKIHFQVAVKNAEQKQSIKQKGEKLKKKELYHKEFRIDLIVFMSPNVY